MEPIRRAEVRALIQAEQAKRLKQAQELTASATRKTLQANGD
jgi:hypothetical protein